jgi:hypothetical protein
MTHSSSIRARLLLTTVLATAVALPVVSQTRFEPHKNSYSPKQDAKSAGRCRC